MRGLPTIEQNGRLRTRRWDAVVLGGALPGLVAAIRLGMKGARVLLLEEAAAADAFPGIREPFLITGAQSDGVLGRCLRELGIPLIDRQRIGSDPLAYQVAFPDARVDIGEPERTCEELVSWKFTEAESARSLLRELSGAATAERDAMLEAPVVRTPRRLANSRRNAATQLGTPVSPANRHARGLPETARNLPDRLSALFGAQIRALSNLGVSTPSPEALARLLGQSQEGSALFAGGEYWLHALLRRRIESLYGEFRTMPGPFRVVSVSNQPGVALDDTSEAWCGRVLLVNAPRSALAAAVAQDPVPGLLSAPAPTRRRLKIHLRGKRSLLPTGMSKRVIAVRSPDRPMDGTNVISLRVFPSAGPNDSVDLVASSVVAADESNIAAREDEIEAGVAELMPFAAGGLARQASTSPLWDSDDWLSDPAASAGWPATCDIRVSSRPATFALDRAAVGGLGFEGDVLLGWRTGDCVAAELA
jgi:hypothetical protein